MKQIYEHHVDIADVKPLINKNGIYFPLKVENGFVEEDGLSFGYPVDCGYYGIVEYEKAVGVLAEDTHAMFLRIHEMKRSSGKPLNLLGLVHFRHIEDWDKDLPPTDCDNYHLWDFERRQAYDNAHKVSQAEIDRCEKIIEIDGDQVFKNPQGEYFAYFKHWFNGKYIPAKLDDDIDEPTLLGMVEAKKSIQGQIRALNEQGNKNLKTLATIFGHTAKND